MSETHDPRGHFVVMGWMPDTHLLVMEVLAARPGLDAGHIVPIKSAGEEANAVLHSGFEGLRYLHGELTDPLVPQRADITGAARTFVPAVATGGRLDQEIGARTAMAPLTMKRQASHEKRKTANVGVLVKNVRRVKQLAANRPVLSLGDDYVVAAQARALVLPRPLPAASQAKQ